MVVAVGLGVAAAIVTLVPRKLSTIPILMATTPAPAMVAITTIGTNRFKIPIAFRIMNISSRLGLNAGRPEMERDQAGVLRRESRLDRRSCQVHCLCAEAYVALHLYDRSHVDGVRESCADFDFMEGGRRIGLECEVPGRHVGDRN